MVIIGGLMIAAVLVDSLRRFWRERTAEIRLNARIDRSKAADGEDPFNLLTELPNGGARIIRRDDLQESDSQSEDVDTAPVMTAVSDPDALDPIDRALHDEDAHAEDAVAGTNGESDSAISPSDDSTSGADSSSGTSGRRRTIKSASRAYPETATADAQSAGPETVDWLDSLESGDVDEVEHGRLPRGANTHVFILYVVASSEEGFSGTDILRTLLACDLRFGDMDFFHRHERASGRGPIEFSVANMMKPGVFDIDNMEPLQTRGLMFFVTLPGPRDMLKAFDYMYETAKVVAKELGGDIQDETRSAVTRQSLEHMRQQIRELERRLLVRRS